MLNKKEKKKKKNIKTSTGQPIFFCQEARYDTSQANNQLVTLSKESITNNGHTTGT